jgi:hypothetical protein
MPAFLLLCLAPLISGLTGEDAKEGPETSPIAQDLHLTLAEGDWWRTSFVSEGATTDGTCVFGLKLYGSQHGPSASTVRCHCSHGPPPARLLRAAAPLAPWGEPLAAAAKPLYGLRSSGLPKVADLIAWVPRPRPTPESYQQSDEGSHHSGEEYRLLVPACALLSARTPTGRYYIGLRGWDGTSKLVLRADEVRFPYSQPICPTVTSAEAVPRHPSSRHSHGAALLHETMLVFGGQLSSMPPGACRARPAHVPRTCRAHAAHVPRTCRACIPGEGGR